LTLSFIRAYQLRERMTQKDRLNAEFLYYNNVTGELDKTYFVLLRSPELFFRDVFVHINLAYTLLRLGQLKRAADDSHMHPIRGGLNYNMELRWDGVPSLADALRMLKEQAERRLLRSGSELSAGGRSFNSPRAGCQPSMRSMR
jgi:hypothetical protein